MLVVVVVEFGDWVWRVDERWRRVRRREKGVRVVGVVGGVSFVGSWWWVC